MLLAVRESATPSGTLTMVGIMRQLTTSEQHILIDSDHRVTGCTTGSFDLLGIQASSLQSHTPKIADWVTEWSAVLPDLSSDAGCFLFVSPLVNVDLAPQQLPGTAERSGGGAWIVAHLQRIVLPTSAVVFVLHWHFMPTDPYSVGKAMAQRRKSLGGGLTMADAADTTILPPKAAAVAAGLAAEGERASSSELSTGAQRCDPDAVSPTPMLTEATNLTASARVDRPLPVRAANHASGHLISGVSAHFFSGEVASSNPLRLPGTPLDGMDADSASSATVGAFPSLRGAQALPVTSSAVVAEIANQTPVCVCSRQSSSSEGSASEASGGDGGGGVSRPKSVVQLRRGSGSRTAVTFNEAKGDGDRGSYASSKQSHGAKLQDKVRRVLGFGVGSLIPGLRLLQWVALLVALLTIGLGIGLGVFIYSSLGTYAATLAVVSESSLAMVKMVDANRNMRTLLFCNLVS